MNKNHCPNESDFETRVQDDGRKLHRCKSCLRVVRIMRKHSLPSENTRSYDATLGILWEGATAKGPCGERFLVQQLKDPVADQRMKCALRKGHRGQHRNHTKDLYWSRGAQIDLSEQAS